MINGSSTKTSIFDVPELKYTALAAQIKAFKLDGNTPSDVCWTALRRIAQLPDDPPVSTRKSKIPLKEEPEFNKKEVINYIKDTLGLEELSKFVDEIYKESAFKSVSWDKTEVTDEDIRRLQGIDTTKIY